MTPNDIVVDLFWAGWKRDFRNAGRLRRARRRKWACDAREFKRHGRKL